MSDFDKIKNYPITPNEISLSLQIISDNLSSIPTISEERISDATADVLKHIILFQYGPIIIISLAFIWLLVVLELISWIAGLLASFVLGAFIYACLIAYQVTISESVNKAFGNALNNITQEFNDKISSTTADLIAMYIEQVSKEIS
jgi:ABC-type transport system involved in cytochrome bd biosynthesis fused ATPase/permease subunit